mmetsp:Transcript_32172/g.70886  ORF Transcript_32172/g.70886 Transcript_32172/m.70886 type:complete len:204 (+) Transcript_32172:647-1258(+)
MSRSISSSVAFVGAIFRTLAQAQCIKTLSLRSFNSSHTFRARKWWLRVVSRATNTSGVNRTYCSTVSGMPIRGLRISFNTLNTLPVSTNSLGSASGQKAFPYDAAFRKDCCCGMSNSPAAAAMHARTASASWPEEAMDLMFSSDLGSPSSNASIASNMSAEGSVLPTERMATVCAGMRCSTSRPVAVTMRRQSGSAMRCTAQS